MLWQYHCVPCESGIGYRGEQWAKRRSENLARVIKVFALIPVSGSASINLKQLEGVSFIAYRLEIYRWAVLSITNVPKLRLNGED